MIGSSDKQKDFAKSIYIKAYAHGFLDSEYSVNL